MTDESRNTTPTETEGLSLEERLANVREQVVQSSAKAEKDRADQKARMAEREKTSPIDSKNEEEARRAAKALTEKKLEKLAYTEAYRQKLKEDQLKKLNSRKKKAPDAEALRAKEAAEEERRARIAEAVEREKAAIAAQNANTEELLMGLSRTDEPAKSGFAAPNRESVKPDAAPKAGSATVQPTPAVSVAAGADRNSRPVVPPINVEAIRAQAYNDYMQREYQNAVAREYKDVIRKMEEDRIRLTEEKNSAEAALRREKANAAFAEERFALQKEIDDAKRQLEIEKEKAAIAVDNADRQVNPADRTAAPSDGSTVCDTPIAEDRKDNVPESGLAGDTEPQNTVNECPMSEEATAGETADEWIEVDTPVETYEAEGLFASDLTKSEIRAEVKERLADNKVYHAEIASLKKEIKRAKKEETDSADLCYRTLTWQKKIVDNCAVVYALSRKNRLGGSDDVAKLAIADYNAMVGKIQKQTGNELTPISRSFPRQLLKHNLENAPKTVILRSEFEAELKNKPEEDVAVETVSPALLPLPVEQGEFVHLTKPMTEAPAEEAEAIGTVSEPPVLTAADWAEIKQKHLADIAGLREERTELLKDKKTASGAEEIRIAADAVNTDAEAVNESLALYNEARSLDLPKEENAAYGILKEQIRFYNADVRVLNKLDDVQHAVISRSALKEVRRGVPSLTLGALTSHIAFVNRADTPIFPKERLDEIAALRRERNELDEQRGKENGEDVLRTVVPSVNAQKKICDIFLQALVLERIANDGEDKSAYANLTREEILLYNRKIDELNRISGERHRKLDEKTPEEVLSGLPAPVIPTLIYEIRDPRSKLPKALRRAEKDEQALALYEAAAEKNAGAVKTPDGFAEILPPSEMSAERFRAHMQEIRKSVEVLKAEERKLEKQRKRAYYEEKVSLGVRELNLQKSVLDEEFALLAQAVHGRHRRAAKNTAENARKEIYRYNQLAETVGKESGYTYPLADKRIPNRILAGKPYRNVERIALSGDSDDDTHATETVRSLYVSVGQDETDTLSLRELQTRRKELENGLNNRALSATDAETLVRIVNLQKHIADRFADLVREAKKKHKRKNVSIYAEGLENEIRLYNSYIDDLNALTDSGYEYADLKIPLRLSRGKAVNEIPLIALRANTEDFRYNVNDTRDSSLYGSEWEKSRQNDAAAVWQENDLALIGARYDYKMRKAKLAGTLAKYEYANEKSPKLNVKKEERRLTKLRKSALSLEEKDVDRINRVLDLDTENAKLHRKRAKRDKLAQMKDQLSELVRERDRMNVELLRLYRGTDEKRASGRDLKYDRLFT
ncbi:MAG: hypothetical protein MJ082_04385, partial [Clostridia bacterium]|nr:hypothetical protein [Clostridia bacterium]